jgi:hypothetical protein
MPPCQAAAPRLGNASQGRGVGVYRARPACVRTAEVVAKLAGQTGHMYI